MLLAVLYLSLCLLAPAWVERFHDVHIELSAKWRWHVFDKHYWYRPEPFAVCCVCDMKKPCTQKCHYRPGKPRPWWPW